ncbi:MAG: hypothetical protein LBK56_14825, partial [Gracilibacteraceae bacterium]|nr:hypothetical protein [Gracilibacteraceae bacterium]
SRPGQAVGSANTGGICGFCQRSQGAKDQVKWLVYFQTVPKAFLYKYKKKLWQTGAWIPA